MGKQTKETSRVISVFGKIFNIPITCRSKNPPIAKTEQDKQTVAVCNCLCSLSCPFRRGVNL